MLTVSRSSWLSLAAGAVYLMLRAEMRQRARLAIAGFACGIFLLGLAQTPAVHDLLMQRMETFSDPSQDVSFSARLVGHEQAFREIANEPFGEGLGSTDSKHNTEGDDDIIGPHDSTVLEFLYSLGWAGTLVYALGLGIIGISIENGRTLRLVRNLVQGNSHRFCGTVPPEQRNDRNPRIHGVDFCIHESRGC